MHMQPRRRIAFTSEQLNRLEDAFQRCPYPKTEIRMKLALETQLSETRIQVWFKNRRAKYRKKLRNKSDNKVLHDISTPKYNSVISKKNFIFVFMPNPISEQCISCI
ncbi:unnamed protein product [Thelazia callipaeda]|uniref:Homeobox domain-containing protein n=1 Tax=Thelazia callipaeda TaxID=103827 RepID=A0A0N5D4V9_THECL|nr:unnamed protein product [Thelazia callipaeda]